MEDYTKEVWVLYGKHLSVHFTACRENSMAKAGVVIVLNKEFVKTDKVETTELILGNITAGAGSFSGWKKIF